MPRSAPPGRAPWRRARVLARGTRADLGRPYVLTVATLEPRKNLATLLEAHALLGGDLALALVGGEGWGERRELDRAGVIRARVRAGRGAARASTAVRRHSRSRRGSRASGCRCSRRWPAACRARLVAPVARRGLRRRGRPRRPGEPGCVRGCDPRGRRRAATSSSPRASSTRAVHLARDRRGAPRRLPVGRCDRPRRDRALGARADARGDGALHARRSCRTSSALAASSSAARLRGLEPHRDRRATPAWYPARCRARRAAAAATSSIARPTARRSARACPSSSPCTTSPFCAIPSAFNRWTREYGRAARPGRACGARA